MLTDSAHLASRACPICGGRGAEVVGRKQERSRARRLITLVRCTDCDQVFQPDLPTGFDDELYLYYERRKGRPRSELYDAITERRYEDLLGRFRHLVEGDRILDVGCGQGQFVFTAQRAGWSARGIDLSEPAIALAQSLGAPAERLDLFDGAFDHASFDVVTAFEVIEHLPDPVRFLSRAIELVRPGGLLYLTTPNFACLDRRVLGLEWEPIHSEHLVYFTPGSLRGLVARASPGVDILELKTLHLSGESVRRIAERARAWMPGQGNGDARFFSQPASAEGSARAASREGDAQLRRRIESSALLRAAKSGANLVLDRLELGNSMTLLARRPEHV